MTDGRTQGWVLQRLRLSMSRNALAELLASSRLRVVTIVVSSLLIAAVVYGTAHAGFAQLEQQSLPGTGAIIGILFDFLFLSLGTLLIFSGGLILYGSLFTAAETAFLLGMPARADQVFAYKLQGAVGFSSWAFVLLGMPILVAFGVVYSVAPLFFAVLPVFFFGYLLIPGSIGALGCLVIVNIAPRRRKQLLAYAIAAVAVAVLAWGILTLRTLVTRGGTTNRDDLQALLGNFEFARGNWVPSHWMTRGLQAAARGDLVETAYPLALVWGNGLMLYLIATAVAGRWYRRGFDKLSTGGDIRQRFGRSGLDAAVDRSLWFLDRPTRLLIVKDFRTFRRDPSQWGQIVLFMGLMMFYVVNPRRFLQSDLGRAFQHGVSLTNLAATAMLMCAYMGRFIFPMLSLEGRKFWILGLLPLSRAQLLRGKFAFAAVMAVGVGEFLVIASDLLLSVPWTGLLVHAVTILAASAGLSGLSVGLGALMPNFRERDPSRIAAGFGGTINLLVGLLFLIVLIAVMAGPYHLISAFYPEWLERPLGIAGVLVGMAAGLGLSAATMYYPLKAGARALERMEF